MHDNSRFPKILVQGSTNRVIFWDHILMITWHTVKKLMIWGNQSQVLEKPFKTWPK